MTAAELIHFLERVPGDAVVLLAGTMNDSEHVQMRPRAGIVKVARREKSFGIVHYSSTVAGRIPAVLFDVTPDDVDRGGS